jgi:hypothetical protein
LLNLAFPRMTGGSHLAGIARDVGYHEPQRA